MSTNFSLTTASPQVNVVQSINYLLATQGTSNANANVSIGNTVVQANTTTGQVYITSGQNISYLYGYLDVAYANTATGGGFTSNSVNQNYYGVRNTSTPVFDTNPVDYKWTQVSNGFGSTKSLFYQNVGGNSINFYIGTAAPTVNFSPVLDSTPILLATLANSIVTSNTIQPKSVTNVQIASNTITGNLIQANTITGNLIQANTIQGNSIVAGTITSVQLAAGTIIVSNSIQSNNATFGSTTSAGFWLDANTGNVRFGGNTSIGNSLTIGANAVVGTNLSVGANAVIAANLSVGSNANIGGNLFVGANATVTGVVTTGSLNANVVNTVQLVQTAATQVISQSNNLGLTQLNFVNGNVTYGGTGYLWPPYTRGFALGGGASIVTTTNGSSTGSSIQVAYNTYINSPVNTTENLIELWRSGGSAYYKSVFQTVRTSPRQYNSGAPYDYVLIPGNAGSLYRGNLGTYGSYVTNVTNNLYDANDTGSGIYNTTYQYVYGTTGETLAISGNTNQFAGNLAGFTSFLGIPGSAYPLFNIYGSNLISPGSNRYSTVLVGSGGYIANWSNRIGTGLFQFETSGVFADLIDVGADILGNSSIGSSGTVNYVAVGTGGTILYNSRTFDTNGNVATTTGWTQAVSNTINNLNSVQCNYTVANQRGNLWVAVGAGGTIVSSASNSGPWIQANSVPTTNNLNAVGYTNGYWMAVGDAGTIIVSTDGTNWTGPYANPADGVTVSTNGARNLYGCGGGLQTGRFVVAGEEIILTANSSNATTTTWANSYVGGSSFTSALTRLQFQGSYANVGNVTAPPASQQINNAQVVSGLYTDINYVSGQTITYYLVAGNLVGNSVVYTNGPNITITEIKR
jgi:hypothetical protein